MLNMTIGQRRPGGVVHDSDQGTQYTSIEFGLPFYRSLSGSATLISTALAGRSCEITQSA
jgi:hypothetical protein